MSNALFICTSCGFQSLEKEDNEPNCVKCDQKLTIVDYQLGQCIVSLYKDHVFGNKKLYQSIESLQDSKMYEVELERYKSSEPTEEEIELWNRMADRHLFGHIRVKNEPTEEEISDWQHYHEFFSKIDFTEIKNRYKMIILREDEPYHYIRLNSMDATVSDLEEGHVYDWMKNCKNYEQFLKRFTDLNWQYSWY